MKRLVSLIIGLIMIFSIFQISAFAAEKSDSSTNTYITQPIKIDNKVPCYGEYEIIEAVGGAKASDEEDQYESNNSFAASTRLNTKPSGRPMDFSVSVNATLHRQSWLWGLIELDVDEDYYRIDVFGKANVSISLTNIPSGCDYDIRLFEHDNIKNAKSDDITQITSSANAGSNPESISRVLYPGTYYIWVYSYNDECSDSDFYNLSINVDYTAQDTTISSLRYNKGAKAALWVSDYDPCGIEAYSQSGKVAVGYMNADYLPAMCFDNPFFNYFKSGNQINQAVLYIWDTDLRNELRSFVTSLYNSVYTQLENDKNYQMVWGIIEAGVSGVISTFECVSSPGLIIQIMLDATPYIATIAKLIFAPGEQSIVTKDNLLDYLRDVRTALEANSQTGNEVIKLNYSYKYKYENALGIVYTTYYFDFAPIPQSEYLYDSDTIVSWDQSSVVLGTIYGICDEDDFGDAIEHSSNYLPDVNTSTLQYIYLNSSIPGLLNVGEYHWFRFVAPSEGTYAFFTENSNDTVGELFNNTVPARSMYGLLASDDDSGDGLNFRLVYTLTAGQAVYLRIHDFGWDSALQYSLRVERTS